MTVATLHQMAPKFDNATLDGPWGLILTLFLDQFANQH